MTRDNEKAAGAGETEKLQKALAEMGLGSRRAMEEVIAAGRVAVNGVTARLGERVKAGDRISVDGKEIARPGEGDVPRVLIYNKPEGEIVSRSDPEGRPSVFDGLPRLAAGRWISIGRLDFNTSGLLIFTTSGRLANLLMHPRYGFEREYLARVSGRLDDETGERLVSGVMLEDGAARFERIIDEGGSGESHWYRVCIMEGRNREVRRLFEAVGLFVTRLVRVRYADIVLPRGLRRGEHSEMRRGAVLEWMRALEERESGAPSPGGGRPRRGGAGPAPSRGARKNPE